MTITSDGRGIVSGPEFCPNEPSSVEFCHKVGMDYVSCSPFRVPIARLAAAQAQLTHPRR